MSDSDGWRDIGEICLCPAGKPAFPVVDPCPGLYRITLTDGRIYIGQTRDLRRRLSEYRHPTQGTEGEHILCAELIEARGGHLAIRTGPQLAEGPARRAAERAEIAAARAAGIELLNPGAGNGSRTILARIAYHERQLASLRQQLAKATARNEPGDP